MSMASPSRGSVCFLEDIMIKRINLVNLFSRYVHFQKKYRLSPSATFASYPHENKRFIKNNIKGSSLSKVKYEDTFGDIESFEHVFSKVKDDPEDIVEYERERAALGKKTSEYIQEIRSHLANHDYKSALHVLEVDMINDKKRLNPYIYRVMISYNAEIGDLKEAYRLFLQFKRRQGTVVGAMYTSLFNACANCENSLLALEKADAVAESMRNNKHHSVNTSNYNAMLKAYGRHGDIPSCLKIMDEVLVKRDKVRSDTYNFLLQACISDKNSGLRHALVIWRKMIGNLVKPDIFSFNLLLKCTSECSLGDSVLIPNLINEINKNSGKFFKRQVVVKTVGDRKKREVIKVLTSGDSLRTPIVNRISESPEKHEKHIVELQSTDSNESSHLALEGQQEMSEDPKDVSQTGNELTSVELSTSESTLCKSEDNFSTVKSVPQESEEHKGVPDITSLRGSKIPNLISLEPSLGSVVEFGVMIKPQHRFMLLGGVKGFLETMNEFGVKPNLKTFTLMLNVIPSTLEAEQELMSVIESHRLKLDTAFFNVLIKRRIFRGEEQSVKSCLEQMYALNIQSDLLTFGILATGCKTYELGVELLNTLRNLGYRVNNEILETLLVRADRARDMNYVLAILQRAKEDEVKIGQKFLAKLSNLVRKEKHLRKKDAEDKLKEIEEASTSSVSS